MFGLLTNLLFPVSLLREPSFVTLVVWMLFFSRQSLTPNQSKSLKMSSTQKYTIVETSEKGQIALASKNILPGELVLCEAEPVLYLDINFLLSFNSSPELEAGIWKKFNAVVPVDKKEKYLALFGPTTGASAERFRNNALQMRTNDDTDLDCMNDEEIDNLVKVMQVMKFNASPWRTKAASFTPSSHVSRILARPTARFTSVKKLLTVTQKDAFKKEKS